MNRWILLALAVGCSPADAEKGDEGLVGGGDTAAVEGDTDTDTDADTDTDTDADTDTDTDTDTDADTDTDTDADADIGGAYTGTIVLTATEDTLGVSDECHGTVDLLVDPDAEPQIQGSARCTFVGLMASAGEQHATLDGSIVPATDAVGTVYVEVLGETYTEDWEGYFAGDDVLGSFAGEAAYEYGGYDLKIRYTGDFEAQK